MKLNNLLYTLSHYNLNLWYFSFQVENHDKRIRKSYSRNGSVQIVLQCHNEEQTRRDVIFFVFLPLDKEKCKLDETKSPRIGCLRSGSDVMIFLVSIRQPTPHSHGFWHFKLFFRAKQREIFSFIPAMVRNSGTWNNKLLNILRPVWERGFESRVTYFEQRSIPNF